jgi:hypothetical protein
MADDLTTDGKVESVTSLLQEIEKSGLLGSPRAHIRVWFRGHADVSWELSPGVYRSGFSVRTGTKGTGRAQRGRESFSSRAGR